MENDLIEYYLMHQNIKMVLGVLVFVIPGSCENLECHKWIYFPVFLMSPVELLDNWGSLAASYPVNLCRRGE